MSESPVSDQVRVFIRDHISSVAQLEILLLLHTDPGHGWSAQDIARELRVETAGATQQLGLLCDTGLLVRETTPACADPATPKATCTPQNPEIRYRYAPVSSELHEGTIALAQAYLVRRVTVIGLIFAKPSDSLRAFSDAFRLRKDPPK